MDNYTVDYQHQASTSKKFCLFSYSDDTYDVKATSNIQKSHTSTPDVGPLAKVLVKTSKGKQTHTATILALSGKDFTTTF